MNNGTGKYDLAVVYRIYPKVAKPALGLPFSNDKFELSEVCLRSFRLATDGLRVKIWALLDGCPPAYADLFRKYFPPEDLVLLPLESIGNQRTFLKQIEILLEQDDAELVYFAEDDYFYLPKQFHAMVDFIRACPDAHFVSPYEHLDHYTSELHREPTRLRVFGQHHWRTVASTCLTFLTTRRILRQSETVFRSYGRENFDVSLWLSLTKESVARPLDFLRWMARHRFLAKVVANAWLFGWTQILFGKQYRLWVPMPGLATHMDASALSPTVDWISMMREEELSMRSGTPSQSS